MSLGVCLCISFFIISSLITGKFVSGDIDRDKKVLLNLESYTAHANPAYLNNPFKDWNSDDKSPCKWTGISCDTSGNHVTAIDLSDKRITGRFFSNFSSLPELRYLNFSDNMIHGRIPDDLGKCRNLRSLNLSNNFIQGDEFNLTGLNNLEVLDLSYSSIERTLMSMVSTKACRNLVVLNLSNNYLYAPVDGIFNLCRNLHSLDLRRNNLSGNVFFQIGWLVELSMSRNSLNGSIPGWVFGQNCSLRALDLSYNFFIGQLPNEISNCKNLESLNLSGNKFSGKIPPEIGSLLSLESLLLGDNSFSRDIPVSLIGMISLSSLDLSRNGFGGDIQDVFGHLHQVKNFFLNGNSYSGGLFLSGIHKLTNISELYLSDNDLFGPLPIEISQMSNLKTLVLRNNSFSGNIPLEYGNLLSLQDLDLSSNKLSGTIPPTFGKLSSILWLALANNSLTGEIPPDIGFLPLIALNISRNKFSGQIPEEIGVLSRLQSLDLSCNNFSGELPKSMSNLSELGRFNISYNPLISGRIPTCGLLSTFDGSAFLGNPLLELENRPRTGSSVPRKGDQGELDELLEGFLFAFVVFYPLFFVSSFLVVLFWGSDKLSVLLKMKNK